MNKAELIEQVAMRADLSKGKATEAVDAVFNEITTALKKGDSVTLVGFGTFSVGQRAERECRNPQTGEKIIVPAHKYTKFRVGKKLKDTIQ